MKFFKSLIILIIFFGVSYTAKSQIFSLGPSVGVTMPVSDYGGSTVDYYNGVQYGLGTGFNIGGVFKAKLPVLINIRAAINYSLLSNSGLASSSNPGSHIEVKHNILLISIGPEFYFTLPGSPIKPYAGVDLLFSSFSGETMFQGVPGVPSNGTYSMSSATRTGLGFGIGGEIKIGSKNALDIGLRYNLHNLFAKSYEGPYDSDRRLDAYIFLNDAKDPRYPEDIGDHPVGTDRNISTVQINLAFLFGF
jgi:hypothetical protein